MIGDNKNSCLQQIQKSSTKMFFLMSVCASIDFISLMLTATKSSMTIWAKYLKLVENLGKRFDREILVKAPSINPLQICRKIILSFQVTV